MDRELYDAARLDAGHAALRAAEAKLRGTLAQNSVATVGQAAFYSYDDPMTLPWRRRNEVALTLAR